MATISFKKINWKWTLVINEANGNEVADIEKTSWGYQVSNIYGEYNGYQSMREAKKSILNDEERLCNYSL